MLTKLWVELKTAIKDDLHTWLLAGVCLIVYLLVIFFL